TSAFHDGFASCPHEAGSGRARLGLGWNQSMATSTDQKASPQQKPATTATLVLAFASVYFFWGSTYTAIRIGAAEMPALLLAGTRFLIAGAILLVWCRWRGLRIAWPRRTMLMLCVIG